MGVLLGQSRTQKPAPDAYPGYEHILQSGSLQFDSTSNHPSESIQVILYDSRCRGASAYLHLGSAAARRLPPSGSTA